MSSLRSRKRRHAQGDDIDPVVQVLAKFSFLDRLFDVPVRRRDHAHIHGNGFRGADPVDNPFLEDPQDFCLQIDAKVSDLIQQQRASVGQLELPFLVLDGAGKGAFHVPEELALDQGLGDGGAVHCHEGAVGPACC